MNNNCLADKKEYIAVDFLKFIAAYMVMSIHFLIFEDINKELNFWFIQVFCRLAVPFFFLVSGYFAANKLQDKTKIILYLKRIFLMYVLYTIIYLPFLIEENQELGYTWAEICIIFLKSFFLWGSYYHLWYFLALIVGILILYFMINYLQWTDKKILLITGILYGIGVLGNAYRNLWIKIPLIEWLFSSYESVFQTTRNGIFFAPFLLALGYYIRKNSDKIRYKNYWLYTILFFGFMNMEEFFARSITNHSGQSMLFITPFVVIMIFLTACFIPIPQKFVPIGVFLRNMSVIIYGFHIYIHLKYGAELSGYVMYGFLYFLMMTKRVTILAAVIVALSRIKIFSWLKYLY